MFVKSILFLLFPLILLTSSEAQTPTNTAPAASGQPPTAPGTDAASSPPDAPPPAPAPPPDPFGDPLIRQIVARHEKAVDGDKKETKALTADLERWTRDEPSNYLLLAYLGSAYTLDSRDAWYGPGKLTYLRKGGQALDAAVAGDPSNPAVRFVRAINYYELPALFGKHRMAYDDFQYLVGQLKGLLPMPYTLNKDTVQAICYYAGLSDVQFDKSGDAKEVLNRGLQLDPKSKLGVKIQAELNKLK